MKEKLRSYGFWLGVLSGVGLIVKEVLALFDLAIDAAAVDQAISVVLGAACVLGVISPSAGSRSDSKAQEDAEQSAPTPAPSEEVGAEDESSKEQ